jgi:hypothetical protein
MPDPILTGGSIFLDVAGLRSESAENRDFHESHRFDALYQDTNFSRAVETQQDPGFKGVEKNRKSPDAISPEGTGQSVARHGSAG